MALSVKNLREWRAATGRDKNLFSHPLKKVLPFNF